MGGTFFACQISKYLTNSQSYESMNYLKALYVHFKLGYMLKFLVVVDVVVFIIYIYINLVNCLFCDITTIDNVVFSGFHLNLWFFFFLI